MAHNGLCIVKYKTSILLCGRECEGDNLFESCGGNDLLDWIFFRLIPLIWWGTREERAPPYIGKCEAFMLVVYVHEGFWLVCLYKCCANTAMYSVALYTWANLAGDLVTSVAYTALWLLWSLLKWPAQLSVLLCSLLEWLTQPHGYYAALLMWLVVATQLHIYTHRYM